MSATGLEVFDKTVQTTNSWLKEISEATGVDRRRAWHILGAVLRALRDRLTLEESADLSAELPLLVRGLYYDQWRPAQQPIRARKRDEFLAMVASGLADIGPIDPAAATQVVFALLERHIAPGEINQIKQILPTEIRDLWP